MRRASRGQFPSLRWKIGLTLLGVVLLYALTYRIVSRWSVLPSFVALERDEAAKDMKRCALALQREVHHLHLFAGDWAGWDDTYKFVLDGNGDYVDSNLSLETFTENRISLLCIVDVHGELVWGRVVDIESGKHLPLNDFLELPLRDAYRAGNLESPGGSSGLLMTSRGPMLASFRPILTSEDEGPARGTFVFGRMIDERTLNDLREQTESAFSVVPVADLDEEQLQVLSAVKRAGGVHVEEVDDQILNAYAEMGDIEGNPGLLLSARIPRTISNRGREALQTALLFTLGGGLVTLLFLMVLLRRTVIDPLSSLTHRVVELTTSADWESRLGVDRRDEIGTLAQEFDRLLERQEAYITEREAMRERVFRSEHLATIGEMSASVAHEIRNPLTGISGAVQILTKSTPDDDDRKPVFLEVLEQVARVERTVQGLLMFAKPWTPEKQRCNVRETLEKACADIRAREQFDGIRIDLDVTDELTAWLDCHLCEQVLTNVLVNAAQAMPDGGEVHIKAHRVGTSIRIVIADRGPGIAPEAQNKVFQPFFTTKTYGTGLGLAVCRQIMVAQGGTIELSSVEGQGTTVTLDVPVGEGE
jgi:signal transduction histidine kinase